jgi:hypothetical protein
MSVFDLQEMPLFKRDDEQTVIPGNDAMVIPTESNLSVAGRVCSGLSQLLCQSALRAG